MSGRLRIGLDAHMVGGRETGNETYVVGLVKGLSALDRDFEVYVYHAAGAMQDGGAHLQPRRLVSTSPWIRLGVDLPVRSLRDRIDVLHSTYTSPVWSRCPVVLTVHDISFVTNPEWFSARDLRVLSRVVPWSVHRAARVITVSEVCRRQIIDSFRVSDEHVVCIHNAAGPAAEHVDMATARADLSALGVDPSRSYVLAVGNLQPRKNLVRLVEAFKLVLAKGIDVDLVIAGAQRYRAEDVVSSAGSAGRRIRFTGYVTDRQLASCYSLATVFAFPSLFEGFGIPALEAMAHGVPVVCANAGALPEVCSDAVVYFDPLDVGSISDALTGVLSDRTLRESLAARGLARSKAFSWVRSAEQTLAVYESAATRSRFKPAAGQ